MGLFVAKVDDAHVRSDLEKALSADDHALACRDVLPGHPRIELEFPRPS